MDRPRTRYARAGDVAIAYQVVGDGPVYLIYASGWLHNIDIAWESPRYRAFLEALSSFSRLILFDKRGTGLSDRNVSVQTLEDRAEDVRAVMDAAGSEKATVFGVSEGGIMNSMFAATYPERTRSIILSGCFPCFAWKPDWPAGRRRGEFEAFLTSMLSAWGEPFNIERFAPSAVDDPVERDHFVRLLIHGASPSSAAALARLNYEIDIRPVLPAIAVPTLVVHRRDEHIVSLEEARYLAENIPGARLRVLEGDDHLPWLGDAEALVEEVRRFIGEDLPAAPEDRILASVLMTDIGGSTERAARVGDAAWRELIEAHDRICARAVARNEGTLIKSTGDGVLAIFPGPSRAIACAVEVRQAAADLDLTVRAGLHVGECLRRRNDVSGLAVNLAARILDAADDGEIWVTSTVRDLMVGSATSFEAAGAHALKGLPGDWQLLRVVA